MKKFYIGLIVYILYVFGAIIFVNVPSFATTTSGNDPSHQHSSSNPSTLPPSIYSSNSLNSQVIASFNSMSDAERGELLESYCYILLERTGVIYSGSDPYSVLDAVFVSNKELLQSLYDLPDDFMSSNRPTSEKRLHIGTDVNGNYYWYNHFVDFLKTVIVLDTSSNQLVYTNSAPTNFLVELAVNQELDDNGIIFTEINSYRNINSSNFPNLTAYNNFIALCEQKSSNGFVLCIRGPSNGSSYFGFGPVNTSFIVAFPNTKPNLYNNGQTVSNTLNFLDNNGNSFTSFSTYYLDKNNNTFVLGSTGIKFGNLSSGSPTISAVSSYSGVINGVQSGNVYLYTTLSDKSRFQLFTSVNGWLNNNGHFEQSWGFTSAYGIPNATISSSNVTNYYNYLYNIDNSNQGNIINGDGIRYPSDITGGDNGYDSDTKTLSFDGISKLLSSLGDLIGSLINGIANGIANIIDALVSVVQNIINFFTDDESSLFSLIKVLLSTLPEPIPVLLTALFSLAVMFGVIKLVKGIF